MLAKKMIRDILKHKVQFISIFLMAFLAVFIFTGINSECAGLEENSNNFYENTNFADGWIYSPYLNDMFLEQVWLLGPTTQMERQLVVDAIADFENDPSVTLHFVENNTISKFYLLEGKPLDINDSEGVWLDKSFADAKGLKVGDNISFEFKGYEIEKEIKGLGYSPEYVYHVSSSSVIPNFNKIGFAYFSYKAFSEDSVPYNVLNVKFDGDGATFEKLLEYRLDGYYKYFLERSDHSSVNRFEGQITQQKMVADIFPIVFILIATLMLLTTMTRTIAHQRTQIGILKASGFKNKTLTLHYVSYGFWLVLIGCILGLILGPLILPPLFYPLISRFYKLPLWNPAWSMDFVYLIVLIVMISLAISLYTVSSISKENPSQTMQPKVPKLSTSGFVERLKIWRRTSFNVRWNYRDAKRNKLRGIMTIIGVIGCTALLIGAFGLCDGQNDIKDWKYNHITHYESKLGIYDDALPSQIDNVADEVNGEKIMEKSIEVELGNSKESGTIQVLNSTDLLTPTDKDWNRIEIADDEVSISQKIADELGISAGDTVRWHILGSNKWIETKIDKIHADPLTQGIILSPNKLDELGLNFTPTSIITSEHVNKTYDGIKATNNLKGIEKSWDKITETSWLMIYISILFACTLAIIALYNLGLLSFTEIEREIATLKVLGFKNNALRRLLLTQNLFFTTIGFILGIPLGLYLLKIMWQSARDSLFIIPSLTITNLLLSATITFSISIVVNLMFSRKIKKLDMVESLKSLE